MCFLCFKSNQSESLDFECSDLFLLVLEDIFVFVTQRKKKTLVEHCTHKTNKEETNYEKEIFEDMVCQSFNLHLNETAL